ncbi:MAG: hypothetical protein LBP92_08015 [Deltaproteobacteria bacterium]|jgi:hypothetical protein|nr:hypothetical protein [Deltaproteobacteria bacterium]
MTFAKPLEEVRVGGEIDAQCTKCRRVTNHRIVSMQDDAIKHVLCLTCSCQHNFRAPAAVKKAAASKAKATTAAKPKEPRPAKEPKETKEAREARDAKKAAVDEREQNREKWNEFKSRFSHAVAVEYSLNGDFGQDQALNHAKFGLGFVTRVMLPNKIEVQFEESLKTLVMHVGPSGNR